MIFEKIRHFWVFSNAVIFVLLSNCFYDIYFVGFGKGDVLCMFCSNYVEYWLIALAAWSCGGCVMPVNCELEPEHLEKQLKLTKAKVQTQKKSKNTFKNFCFCISR